MCDAYMTPSSLAFANRNVWLMWAFRGFYRRQSLALRTTQHGKHPMSKKAAEHHKQSAEHHTHAARHHGEAAKHHESGHHEKAAHHAHTARGHALHARHHSDEAAMAHMNEHGKK
jgi:hypothetical protein